MRRILGSIQPARTLDVSFVPFLLKMIAAGTRMLTNKKRTEMRHYFAPCAMLRYILFFFKNQFTISLSCEHFFGYPGNCATYMFLNFFCIDIFSFQLNIVIGSILSIFLGFSSNIRDGLRSIEAAVPNRAKQF